MNKYTVKKFIPYSYNISNKKLKEMSQAEAVKDKTFYVIAGANGSGKSTYATNLYFEEILNVPYVNADIIRGEFEHIENEQEKNRAAMFTTMDRVVENLKSGNSILYETVLSHPSKLEIINLAKTLGYDVEAIFMQTQSPDINLKRVTKRISEGGHSVPKDKIISRWQRTQTFKKQLEMLSDNFYEIDNSQDMQM